MFQCVLLYCYQNPKIPNRSAYSIIYHYNSLLQFTMENPEHSIGPVPNLHITHNGKRKEILRRLVHLLLQEKGSARPIHKALELGELIVFHLGLNLKELIEL